MYITSSPLDIVPHVLKSNLFKYRVGETREKSWKLNINLYFLNLIFYNPSFSFTYNKFTYEKQQKIVSLNSVLLINY